MKVIALTGSVFSPPFIVDLLILISHFNFPFLLFSTLLWPFPCLSYFTLVTLCFTKFLLLFLWTPVPYFLGGGHHSGLVTFYVHLTQYESWHFLGSQESRPLFTFAKCFPFGIWSYCRSSYCINPYKWQQILQRLKIIPIAYTVSSVADYIPSGKSREGTIWILSL